MRRTSHGVSAHQRPANLERKVVKGGLIFQEKGRGKNRKLVLMYKLQATAHQPADVPFSETFARKFKESALVHFPARMSQAMRSRR